MANTKITNPKLFNLGGSTSATQLPVMTTTERNAMTGMSNGELIFNSTTDSVEYYDLGAAAWYKITSIPAAADLKFDPNKLWYNTSSRASVTEDNRLFKGNKDLINGQAEGECYTNYYFQSGGTNKYYMEMEIATTASHGIYYLYFTDSDAYTGQINVNNAYAHRIGYYYGVLYGSQYSNMFVNAYIGTLAGGDSDSRTHTPNPDGSGDAVAVAVDESTRKVWFGSLIGSTVSWIGGGNPATGSTPTLTLPSGWGTYQLSAADGSWSSSSARHAHHRIRQEANITGSLPSGFSHMKGVYEI